MRMSKMLVIAFCMLTWTSLARGDEMHNAVAQGDLAKVKTLLEQNAPFWVNQKDLAGATPLFEAVRRGNKAIAELLISHGADVNAADVNQNTPLHWAARNGLADMAEMLVNHGASIDVANRYGQTPKDLAMEHRHPEIVEILESGGTIFEAIKLGVVDKVKRFLTKDPALVNAKDGSSESTPLHLAANKGNKEIAELLLAKGADVNAKDKFGWTPLHEAAVGGHVALVELLLANKADVNAKDEKGWTPLKYAAGSNQKAVVELLKKHGGTE